MIYSKITDNLNFYGDSNPIELIKKYGSPLYVYNETILRTRIREMKSFLSYKNFTVNYSAKANSNHEILKIVKDEGIHVDAVSMGEIFVELNIGFKSDEIFFVCNNVNTQEMKYAIEHKILMSVDSVSQLEKYGKLNKGGDIAIRFNPGIGTGHHEHVITGGKKTKFGVDPIFIPEVKEILKKYDLNLIGINQHLGSLFMEGSSYIKGINSLLYIAKQFDNLKFIDLGGGFGIPYYKHENESRLNLISLGQKVDKIIKEWTASYSNKDIEVKIEPGRYISAEMGVLLGEVTAIKTNYNKKYIGTDIGFNTIMRPVMYGSHHDVEIYRENGNNENFEEVTIVGNICESGDIIANERFLPEIKEDDIIGVLDAGAYGFSMASNYNNRLKPAEVLIQSDGSSRLIRERETFDIFMN